VLRVGAGVLRVGPGGDGTWVADGLDEPVCGDGDPGVAGREAGVWADSGDDGGPVVHAETAIIRRNEDNADPVTDPDPADDP